MNEVVKAPDQRRGRLQLLMLVVVFGAPLVASYVMYFTGWLPQGRANRGVLIDPVVPLPSVMLARWDGGTFELRQIKDQWLMLAVSAQGCAEACRANLYKLRQVRKAVGEGALEVERALVILDGQIPVDRGALERDYKDTIFLVADRNFTEAWLPLLKQHDPAVDGSVYLVDPRGNLMMRYAPGQDGKDLLKDLLRLLAASRH